MTRAYLRLDPGFYERKLEQGYPLAAIGAFCGVLCLAEMQPVRGRFRNVAVLKALLGATAARQVPILIEKGDLVLDERGRLYVDGWDEWQEGDVTVKERMQRVRNKQRNGRNGTHRNGTHADDSHSTVPPMAGRGGADSGTGQPARLSPRFSDAYKAFGHCQPRPADDTEKRWIDELCRDFGREAVARAFYEDSDPAAPGLLGRVSKTLRKGKVA